MFILNGIGAIGTIMRSRDTGLTTTQLTKAFIPIIPFRVIPFIPIAGILRCARMVGIQITITTAILISAISAV